MKFYVLCEIQNIIYDFTETPVILSRTIILQGRVDVLWKTI